MNFGILRGALLAGIPILLPSLMAQAPASGDGNWPKEIVTDQIRLLLYQPQADSWKNNRIEARSAVMVTQLGNPKEMFGMIVMSARTEVDRETRTVTLEDIDIKEANFPSAGSLRPTLLTTIRDSVPNWPKNVSLDRLLADLCDHPGPDASGEYSVEERTPADHLQYCAGGADHHRRRTGLQAG